MYVCDPVTVKFPFEPLSMPAEVLPSPQSIVMVKSAATFCGLALSVNVATVTLVSAWFGLPEIVGAL